MAKILFLVPNLEGGGAERQLILLSRELVRAGHDVTIAVWFSGGPYEPALEGTNIRYLVLEKHGQADIVGFLRRTRRIARELRPDVIHGYLETANFVAAMLGQSGSKPRIAWGIRASHVDFRAYDFAGRVVWHVNRLVSRLADVIIANSHAGAANVIAQGYPAARVRVIPNGIDVNQFRPVPDRARALRAAWGVAPHEQIVGLAARLDPMKDHETFVAAARLLSDRRPNVRFVCVGDGREPYRSAALKVLEASRLGDRMRWLGFVHDMPAFYSAIDVATSSSRFGEGFPNAIGEAMACGIPCAVTDVGDSRMIVGDTGVVVRACDSAALTDAWEQLLDRRGPELAQACRGRIVKSFSVARLAADTEDAILPPGEARLVSR